MTITFPLWALVPSALAVAGLWLLARRGSDWDFVTPLAGLACLGGAALFLLGRCAQ